MPMPCVTLVSFWTQVPQMGIRMIARNIMDGAPPLNLMRWAMAVLYEHSRCGCNESDCYRCYALYSVETPYGYRVEMPK